MLWYVSGKYRTLVKTLLIGSAALLSQSVLAGPVQNAGYRPSSTSNSVVMASTASSSVAAASVAPSVPVKSYREWKLSMVSEAEGRLKSAKESLSKVRQVSNTDPNLQNSKSNSDKSTSEAGLNFQIQSMQDLITKEQMHLSLAEELTITDYFVGYLAKQKSFNQAIKDVSGKLSPEEVAELMTAYANNFFRSRPQSVNPAPRADSDQY